jgi:hypothetical protein
VKANALGSTLDDILDLAGLRVRKNTVPTLERVGVAAPDELRSWLARTPVLKTDMFVNRHIIHPFALPPLKATPDRAWRGALPDVKKWLKQLKKPWLGELQGLYHLVGLYPLGLKRDHHGFDHALAGLDPWGPLPTGGVFQYSPRGRPIQVCPWGDGTLGGFLLEELKVFFHEARRKGDDDPKVACFLFDELDLARRRPRPLDRHKELWWARAEQVSARVRQVQALLELMRGEARMSAKDLTKSTGMPFDQLPGKLAGSFAGLVGEAPLADLDAQWLLEKQSIARSHACAMFWLLAHWLLERNEHLAETVRISEQNPSKLVAALRDHVR